MTIYLILLLMICAFGYISFHKYPTNKNKIIFYIITSISLILISSFRYSIGFDYFSYKGIYENIANTSWSNLIPTYPMYTGYAILNKLVSILNINYTIFLFIVNAIITIIITWFIYKYSKLPWLSYYIYVSFQFFAHSMNLFRQSIAATIFLLAYPFLKEKKFFRYLIIVLIASTFHISALLLIPVYFVVNCKFSLKLTIPISIIGTLTYIFSDQVTTFITKYIYPNFAHYIDSPYWNGNGIRYILLPTAFFIICIISKKILIKNSKANNVLLNLSFLTFWNYIFITRHFILERFAIYFFIFAIITLPEIYDSIKIPEFSKKTIDTKYLIEQAQFYKNMILTFTIVAGGAYMIFAATKGFHKIYPYISIFNQ